jgi:hypothetical protein
MIAATNYVATVDGELVAHLAVSPAFHQGGCFRASRLVVILYDSEPTAGVAAGLSDPARTEVVAVLLLNGRQNR